MASPLRPDGLTSEFIEDIEIPEVRRSTMDPVGELKQRLYAQPQVAAQQTAQDLSALRGRPPATATRFNAQAPAGDLPEYRTGAGQGNTPFRQTPTPTNPNFRAPPGAAQTEGIAARAASRLRGVPGAAAARSVAGKVVGAAGKIAAPLGGAIGAAQSFGDTPEYRQSFEPAQSSQDRLVQAGLSGRQVFGDNAVGNAISSFEEAVNPVVDSVGQNALRVMGNVGNALTGGYAERIGNVLTGGSISDPTARERSQGIGAPGQFGSAGTDAAAQTRGGPQVFDNAALQARGLNTTPEAANPANDPNSVQSILRSMLQQGTDVGGTQGAVISGQGGVSGVPDNFDKLRQEVIDAHGGGRVARGTLAKKLMQIEEMRQGRQTADQQNATQLRGQDQAAASALRANQLGVANTLADYDVQGQTAQAQNLRARAEAQKFQSELGEKGFERFNKLTDGLFQTTDEDGKPTSDTAKAERFRSYIMGSDPKSGGGVELLNLSPQEQAAAIQNLRTQFEIQEQRNAEGGGFGAMTQNTFDPAAETRDAALSDVFGRGLSAKDYIYSNLPFTDNEVVQTQSGQSRLRSDYVQDDADRLRELEKYAKKR